MVAAAHLSLVYGLDAPDLAAITARSLPPYRGSVLFCTDSPPPGFIPLTPGPHLPRRRRAVEGDLLRTVASGSCSLSRRARTGIARQHVWTPDSLSDHDLPLATHDPLVSQDSRLPTERQGKESESEPCCCPLRAQTPSSHSSLPSQSPVRRLLWTPRSSAVPL